MNPKWYPGYFVDPQQWSEWMPDAMDQWLPSSPLQARPAPALETWLTPSLKPSYALFSDLLDGPRRKSLEEQRAELPTLLPYVPPSKPNSELLWTGLAPAPPQPEPLPNSPSPANAAKSLPPFFPRWPDYVMTTAGMPAKVAGLGVSSDVPATPALPVQWLDAPVEQPQAVPSAPAVPYTESANYWAAGPKAPADPLLAPYLSPVPPAPAWNEVRTKPMANETEIFAAPPDLPSWHPSVPLSFDEAAAAMAARRAGAMTTGQWRARGTEEYESPPPPPAPQPPEPLPPGPERNHAYYSNRESFFVRDKTGNYYPATFLTYSDGTPVVDDVLAKGLSPHPRDQLALFSDTRGTIYNPNNLPDPGNGNPDHYLVVPDRDFMNVLVSRGVMYGDQVRGDDVQRQTGGQPTGAQASVILGGTFVPKAGTAMPNIRWGEQDGD